MKYRSLFAALISIGLLFSISSCMKRSPVRVYDESNIAPAEAARIRVPADTEVLSIDGRRVKSVADYILSRIDEIHVNPGEHEIVVIYRTFWEHGRKRHEEIRSKEITLKFNAKRGALYTLAYPELNDVTEAKRFAENPDIWVAKIAKYSDKKNEGTRVSRSVIKSETGNYTEPEEPAIMEKDISMTPERQNDRGSSGLNAQIEESPAMKENAALKQEWDSLNDEEREEFRKWLEWNSMSEEEKEKFREWTNSNKE